MRRLATALLLLSLAGCDRRIGPAIDNGQNAADATNAMPAENDAGNQVEPPRSILRPEVAEAEAPKIEPLDAVIHFGTSGLKLDEAGRAAIDALLDTPAMKAGGPVTLRGHSDSHGADGDNRAASRIRAAAVAAYLEEKGIAKDRITLIALGEARPAAPNAKEDGSDDPEGRAKNRRVEIHVALPPVIVPPPGVVPAAATEKK